MIQKEWVITIKDELMNTYDMQLEQLRKRSIYKIPGRFSDVNNKAYEPQAISFGPYHHGEQQLKPMEEHKHRALLHFLRRSNKSLECYVNALSEVIQDLKDSYDSLDIQWQQDNDAFLQMMILDGCFLLEILRVGTNILDDYDPIDPVFSNHGKLHVMPYLRRDMLLLENQLPLLVVDKLLQVETDVDAKKDEEFINNLILDFFSLHKPPSKSLGKCLHLLDAYRKSLLASDRPQKKKASPLEFQGGDEIIQPATELSDAGIHFKKSKSRRLNDVKFRGGVLKLPLIYIDDATAPIFLNLIAFEKCHVGAGNEVTSYISFMSNIIDNGMDVSLLYYSDGIIVNALGSDEDVAQLFKTLSKDIVTLGQDEIFSYVNDQVIEYCNRRWPKWRGNMVRAYFRNPWAIVSVLAAKVLFVLTIVQTVYTILPLYQHSP